MSEYPPKSEQNQSIPLIHGIASSDTESPRPAAAVGSNFVSSTAPATDRSPLSSADSSGLARTISVRSYIYQTILDQRPSANAWLTTLILTAVLSVISYWFRLHSDASLDWASASWSKVAGGEWYRLWTTIFVHGDLGHLISNAFYFSIFSYFLLGYFSFWLFPVLAFFISGLVNLVVLPTYHENTTLIGASGLTYLMGGVWLALYFRVARNRSFKARFLRAGGVILVLFMPHEYRLGISERTHMVGLAAGLLLGFSWYYLFQKKLTDQEVWREEVIEDELAVSISSIGLQNEMQNEIPKETAEKSGHK
jgi:rhomboid protease GluP